MAIGTIGEGLFELGLDEHDVYGPVRRGYGGDAANTAVMAARLGHEARLCSRVGVDALGGLLLTFWRESGVDTRWVVADDSAPTVSPSTSARPTGVVSTITAADPRAAASPQATQEGKSVEEGLWHVRSP